jgi:hypothetical protein
MHGHGPYNSQLARRTTDYANSLASDIEGISHEFNLHAQLIEASSSHLGRELYACII